MFDLASLARKIDCDRRRVKAEGYTRQAGREILARFLPADLFRAAMAEACDPATTWAVIRHLCAVKRRMGALLGRPAVEALRSAITNEIHLFARQRHTLAGLRHAAE